MSSLNLDLDFFDHPKTKRLVAILGKGSEVLPIKLWAYAGKFHAKDGRLADYSAEEVESLISWWGKPGECVAAMVRVGYLVQEGKSLKVHEWAQYQGHIHTFKLRGQLAAAKRWGHDTEELQGCLKHATSITASNASSNALAVLGSTKERESKWPSLEEVKVAASMQAIPEETAQEFWEYWDMVFWVDGKGRCVASNWRKRLGHWHKNAINRAEEKKARGKFGKGNSVPDYSKGF